MRIRFFKFRLEYGKASVLLLVLVFLFMKAEGQSETDRLQVEEFWQEFYIHRDIGQKLGSALIFNNFYRTGYGFYDWFVQGKLAYQLNAWFEMEALYRHESYSLGEQRVQEYRPMLRAVMKKKIGLWSLRNRHRLEYRMFKVGESHFRYRTDVKIKPRINWTSWKLNPYVTEELFFSHQQYGRNRIYTGVEGKKGKTEPGAYVAMQSDKGINSWEHRLIVGIVLGLEL
ncbi:DUF2490 domain-containing protein [Sunxiuqinia rutila]|uniref:DUF2490 domain-containing protein n=1 Tax=Sunxiuqinia rutila TaxID=1397841 RepID=UPI003D3692DF